ncbi:MAG TPA: AsmA family protein [Dongiaceae bacterium]|jgi:hypothetical protein
MRIKHILTGLVILVVGIAAAMLAIIHSIDFNAYKDLIAQQVQAATGRQLVLAGDVHVGLSLTPSLEVQQVSFRNADWGSEPQMLKFDRLEADVALLPLLASEIRIKRLRLVGADILLETDKNGQGNWVMGNGNSAGSAPLPEIGETTIENAKLRFHNGVTGRTHDLMVDKLVVSPNGSNTLTLAFNGQADAVPVALNGTIGTLADFVHGPLPVNLTGKIGGGDASIKGQVADPASVKGIAFDLSMSGKSLSDLNGLTGATLPASAPYQVQSKLLDQNGAYEFDGLSGRVGGSDFTGKIELDPTKAPLAVNVNLASSHLDVADFGFHPDAQRSKVVADGHVFSPEPWPLTALRAVNGTFRINAQQAVIGSIKLDNLAGDMSLDSGHLKITSLTAGLGEGTLGVAANIDGASDPGAVQARVKASNVDGAPLFDALGLGGALTAGRVNVEAALQGPGSSLRDLMAKLNGGIYLEMGQGAIRNDFAKLMFADVFQLVTFGGTADTARVNCMVTQFDAVDGIAAAKSIVLDTPGVTIVGSGDINLRDETLALHFDSNSKQVNLANLAVPINVQGTLSRPSVVPDALGAVGNTADFAARAANTATFGVLSSLTGVGASRDLGPNPCVNAAQAGAAAKHSSAVDKVINGAGEAAQGAGEGAKELGQGALDATKKAGQGAGKALNDLGNDIGGVFGN